MLGYDKDYDFNPLIFHILSVKINKMICPCVEITNLPPFSNAAVTCLNVVTSSSNDSLMERRRAFCPSNPLWSLSVLRAVCISDILRAVFDPECRPDCLGEGLTPTIKVNSITFQQ